MGNWILWILAFAVLPIFSQFTKELRTWNFENPYIIFYNIGNIALQAWFVGQGDPISDKIGSCEKEEMFIFIWQFCVTLSAENTVSKRKCK